MAKEKWKVVSKSKNKKSVVVQRGDGKLKILLTPKGKVAKYKSEIKNGWVYGNDGNRLLDSNGKPLKLTKGRKAYRKGYLHALGEQAAIYKKQKSQ